MLSKFAETTIELDDVSEADKADASYLDAFGLYLNPFPQVPDERFYFESAPLRQRMETLKHMVSSNDALLFVTADEGGGKTSFMRAFASACEGVWQAFEITVDAGAEPVQVLRAIAAGMHAKVKQDMDEQHKIIFEQLEHLNKQDCYPVVAIDDGHRLSSRAIATLQKLKSDARDLGLKLSIVLFANREIKHKFKEKALRKVADEWIYSIYLPRLSQKDTEQYLTHRLTVAGMFIDQPFSNSDIATIYQFAKGLPRKTNIIAHRMLLNKYGTKEPSSKTRAEPTRFDHCKQWFNGLSRENKMYMAMSAVLLFVVFSVGPKETTPVAAGQKLAMQANAVTDGDLHPEHKPARSMPADNRQQGASKPLPLKVSSSTTHTEECDGMADLFVDCNKPNLKPGQSIKKNISYR